MAPPLVPELLEDTSRKLGEPPWIKGSREGLIGHRDYLLRTLDEVDAYNATFAVGSPWSVAFPSLLLSEKTTRRVGGKDSPDTGTGGVTIVSCEYATPRLGKLPPPTVNTKYSVISFQDETANVYYGFGDDPGTLPIANGEGAARCFGMMRARIYTYYNSNANINWGRIASLCRFKYLNANPIQLPAQLNTTAPLNFTAGQVRYENCTPNSVNGLLELCHEVSMAEDFSFRWFIEDENGFAGPGVQSQIYETGDLGGLW